MQMEIKDTEEPKTPPSSEVEDVIYHAPWEYPQGHFDFLCQYLVQKDPLVWNGLRRDLYNLLVPLSGKCIIGDGKHWIDFRPGEIMICEPQKNRIFKQYGVWKTYWFLFNPRCPIYWPEPITGFYLLQPDRKTYKRILRDAMETCRIAATRQGDWLPLAQSLIETLIQRGNFFSRNSETDARMMKATALLAESQAGLNIDEIASECGFSRASFYKKFKDLYGMTPREYHEKEQLLKVESLLQVTDMTISEIAEQTSFSSVCYLTKRFRKVFGITPTEARRRIRNKEPGCNTFQEI